MELDTAAQSQTGIAMMAQTLQNATMGADIVTKTISAGNQINAGAGGAQQPVDTRAVAEATGKGLRIDAAV
ncbi:hypothetical protein [Desulfonatronum lacustre]|uniref:hypothetical protein n=1 Tax=Desulfonatronum lacustre TaxID=66849 RepID=UPI00048DDD69|nr:hypothetical protein [Desulfonatronum lacustre]SMP71153.1 hypothetical protein SAMN06295888_11764 [Desulfonatronum zhilinae]